MQAQNQQVAVDQLGGAPAIQGQRLNATISAQDRLQTPQQFRDIVVGSIGDGSVLRLGDVARVEVGAETYEILSFYNGKPASGIAVSMATGAKALDTSDATLAAVRDRLRPIVMTSLAFGLGVLPLAISSGAGSGAQNAIGTGVLGGMIAGTSLGLFFIPLFFVVVQSMFGPRKRVPAPAGDTGDPDEPGYSLDARGRQESRGVTVLRESGIRESARRESTAGRPGTGTGSFIDGAKPQAVHSAPSRGAVGTTE